MLMGPQATRAERAEFRERIVADPRKYIAQHRVELSTCPTWEPRQRILAPRRVDLRPYILTSPEGPWVLPGGLSRVALREGSYVVNSSQGGGSKDTWVLAPRASAGARELGAAEVVRSLPKSMSDPVLDGSAQRTQKQPLQAEQPQDEQPQQQQQQQQQQQRAVH